MIEKRIVLIDGEKLTKLMLVHNFGVSTKQVFEIKMLDTDFLLIWDIETQVNIET